MSTRTEKRTAAVKTLVDAAVMARDVRALGTVSGSLQAYAPADMQAIVQGITDAPVTIDVDAVAAADEYLTELALEEDDDTPPLGTMKVTIHE